MRCKACDSVLKDSEIFIRTIEVDGKEKKVFEDLCKQCRSTIPDYDDEVASDMEAIEAIMRKVESMMKEKEWDD